MPITPHRIQAGKNDPRILKDGAREHPVAGNVASDSSGDYPQPQSGRIARCLRFRLHVTESSHKVGRRFDRPEQPIRLTVGSAPSRLRCAHLPTYAAPTQRRFGCALRSCKTLTPHCRTPLRPPAAPPQLSVDEAQCGRSSTPTTPGFPLDHESSQPSRQPVSDSLALSPDGFPWPIRQTTSTLR